MTKSYHAHLQAQLQGLEFLSFLELHFHASVSALELFTRSRRESRQDPWAVTG